MVLDQFAISHPPPVPPTITKKVFGGEEKVENYDDENYKRELFSYHLILCYDQILLLLPAINILDEWKVNVDFLEHIEAGSIDTSSEDAMKSDFLTFVALRESDMNAIVSEIFYQSTTTDRGIREAEKLFNVTWFDQDIYTWKVNSTPGKFSRFFEDRQAAIRAHYRWCDFVALPGPEQSAVVAHYRLSNRLEHLASMMKTQG